VGHGSQSGAHPVIARAAGRNLGIFERHPAERDEQLRVLRQYRKRGMRSIAVVHVRDDVRHQCSPGAQAVAIHATHVAAEEVQEAMQLTDGVMKTPRAGPSVRAAENRAIAVLGEHANELACDELRGGCPIDLDEWFASTPLVVRTRTAFQKASAHGRAPNAQACDARVELVETNR